MHKLKFFLVTVVLLTLVTRVAVPGALAQNHCDQLLLDEANVFGGQLASVEAEAQRLVNLGADVRVRTIQTYGAAGTLDNYQEAIERECASWRAPDGGRKNNLIVLMVAVQERRTGCITAANGSGRWARTGRGSRPTS
jgi:hypothetical protein